MLHFWHKLCCFQPKTLILALFWVNRGDILGNEIFDFGLMHRKSSCLFIISLECFCLWIWNIKMAIVQTNERTYPCHFQTFELRPSARVYVRRKFERRDGISGTFLNQQYQQMNPLLPAGVRYMQHGRHFLLLTISSKTSQYFVIAICNHWRCSD